MKDVRGILPEPSEEELEDFVRWWFNPRPHPKWSVRDVFTSKEDFEKYVEKRKKLEEEAKKDK